MLRSVAYYDGRIFVWKKASEEILIKKYINCDDKFEDESAFSFPSKKRKCLNCTMHVAGETLEALYVIVEEGEDEHNFVVNVYRTYREKSKWSLRDVGFFQVREPVIERIHLSQDLCLIWNCEDYLNVLCCRTALEINVLKIPTNEQLKKILLLHSIYNHTGMLNDVKKVKMLLVVAETAFANERRILFCVLIIDSQSTSFTNQVIRLPTNYFISTFYSSIISAINISKLNISNDKFTTLETIENIRDIRNWSENSTVVCTRRKQFVVFINGCAYYICSIPFPDVHQIINFKTYSPIRTFYVLQSLKGACSVKRCEFSKQLQICSSWEDSIAVVVGDFINAGTVQLLFISQFGQDLTVDTCVLTNINVTFYPRAVSPRKNASWSKNAIKGMKKSVLAGQIAFSEARRKQIEMQKVIDEITQRLELATSSDMSQRNIHDSNLVNIIPPNEGPVSLIPPKKDKPLVGINILAVWKTVLQDHWILGWSLINQSNMVFSNFNIHLTTQKETLEYVSKCYKHLSSGTICQPNLYFDENYSGDLKEGEILSIVISLPLPAFIYSKLNISSIIRWENSSTSHQNGPFKQHLSLMTQLSVHSALEKQQQMFKELSLVQQLMSLRVLQDQLSLHLRSEHTDLAQIEKILTLSLECYPHVLSHLSSKINIFMDPMSPLYGINFSVNCSSPRETQFEIHYREIKQLFLFIHWLYDALPEDVTISTEFVSTSKLKQVLLLFMKEELLSMTMLSQNQNRSDSLPLLDESDLSSLHHHVKSEQEQILKNSLTLNIKDYIVFRLQLLEKESNNDDTIGQILYKQ